jgi:dTDP-4-amino-4,6-dideoxygalactose transaminase
LDTGVLSTRPEGLSTLARNHEGHVRLLNLGRSAIQVALEAMDLAPGSGVIVPSYACAGVVLPVMQAGLRPVLADIGDDLNLTLDAVRAAHEPDVRAAIVPHLAGVWVRELDDIVEWAGRSGIRIIEDVAHAHGLSVDGVVAGASGDAAIFSSGGGKPIFGPGGGWLVTRDDGLAERAARREAMTEPSSLVRARLLDFIQRFARPESKRGRAWVLSRAATTMRLRPAGASMGDAGISFPVAAIADVEAALLNSMLPRMPELLNSRRANGALWRAALSPLESDGFRIAPQERNSHTHLWLSFRGPAAGERASEARTLLWRHGVETADLYVPLHRRPILAHVRRGDLSVTENLWRGVFLVPVRPSLRPADRDRIASAAEALAGWIAQNSTVKRLA